MEKCIEEYLKKDKLGGNKVKKESTKFSVIIPAHNEGAYIGKCLESIKVASKNYEQEDLEIIVVANRCTDETEEIALKYGARVVKDMSRNLAHIRNEGVKNAKGQILITIDADSQMTSNMLEEVENLLKSGRYIGGGVKMKFDKFSFGMLISTLVIAFLARKELIKNRVSGGMFWCYRQDFHSVGRFNEKLVSVEDIDFAVRLKAYGQKKGKKFKTISKAHIVTSSRKFDTLGEWYLLKNLHITKRILKGNDQEAADAFYYDFNK